MKILPLRKQNYNALESLDDSLDAADMLENRPQGLVALIDGRVVGFVIYESAIGSASINKIVVDEEYRRRGVGTQLVRFLQEEFVTVDTFVDEYNLEAQLFLRSLGFVTEPQLNDRSNRKTPRKRVIDDKDEYYMVYQEEAIIA